MKAVLTREENLLTSNFTNFRYIPGGPVVGSLPSTAGDMGLIPGQGTKIPHAVEQLSPHTPTQTQCSKNNSSKTLQLRMLI